MNVLSEIIFESFAVSFSSSEVTHFTSPNQHNNSDTGLKTQMHLLVYSEMNSFYKLNATFYAHKVYLIALY